MLVYGNVKIELEFWKQNSQFGLKCSCSAREDDESGGDQGNDLQFWPTSRDLG